jgi:hypothetical protein
MLRIFRRLFGPAPNPSQPSGHARASAKSGLPVLPEPIPVPEVVEGNGGESDWNLWQNSMLSVESGFQQLDSAAGGYENTQPLTTEELKAFTKARSSGAS